MATTIEQLELEVQSNTASAVSGLEALSETLGKVKAAAKGGMGLTSVSKRLESLNTALSALNTGNFDKLSKVAESLEKLKSVSGVKISPSIANQLTKISAAADTLNNTNFGGIQTMKNALAPLNNVTASEGLKNTISQLKSAAKLPGILSGADWTGMRGQIEQMVNALAPLKTLEVGTGLGTAVSQLKAVTKISDALGKVDWSKFTAQIQQLSNALAPLATQLNTIGNAFSQLPSEIKQVVAATNQLTSANSGATRSYTSLWAKASIFGNVMKRVTSMIASWIQQSNQYVEDINLFDASMGKYAESAQDYAEKVGEVLGIDPGEFMRNQGTFNTIITGFGVVSDKAYMMSQNLTQLSYDLASFFNISFDSAMKKVQSGISGELEPMRALGYDLSVARLQEEALALGIKKKVSAMTQAEKSQLRYYAMLTQVTTAQGDMARTLNAPANQIRVLKAQLTQCARALGNIFIPALNAVLPYVIAVTKAVRKLAEGIANLVGFELSEVDYSGLGSITGAADDMDESMENATDTAKKLKRTIMGFDELNVLQKADDSSKTSTGSGLGSNDLGIDLPSYDFLGDAVSNRVDEIIRKMKEWLGLTGEINNLNDLLHTRLGRILTTVGAIGAGLAAWKISNAVISGLKYLEELKKSGLSNAVTIAVGISLLVTGVALEWAGIMDAIQNEVNKMNFAQIIAGMLFTVAGGAVLGKGLARWITTAFKGSAVARAIEAAAANLGGVSVSAAGAALGAGAAGIIAGIPAYLVGIWDALKNGLNWLNGLLIPAGSTAAVAGAGAIFAALGGSIGSLGGPVLAGIGALVGLAIGLVTDGIIAVKEHWTEITGWFSQKWAGVKSWWSSTVSPFFASIGDGIKNGLETAKQAVTEKFTAITDFVGSVPDKIRGAMDTVKTAVVEKWNAVTDFMSTVPEKVGNVVNAVGQWFSGLPDKIAYSLGFALGHTLKWAADTKTAMEENVSQAVTSAVQWFTGLPERISGGLESARTSIAAWGTNVYGSVTEAASQSVTSAQTWFTSLPERISSSISGTYERVAAWGAETKARFNEAAASIITETIMKFSDFAQKFYDSISKTGEAIAKWGTDMVKKAKKAAGDVVNAVVKGIKELPDKLKALGKDIVDGFVQGLKDAWKSITDAVKSFVDSFVNGFKNGLGIHSPSTVFQSIGLNVVAGLQNGLRNIGSVFTSAFSTIGSWVSGFGKNMYTWGSDLMGNMVSGISSGLRTLKDKVSEAASTIRSYLHFSQPDVGPLADFNTWMPDMMSQLAGGIAKDTDKVRKQVENLAGVMSLEPTVQANVNAAGGTPAVRTNSGDNTAELANAVYNAVSAALHEQNSGEDSGTPIVINLGNEQIASFMVKQNRRAALISGGRA